MRPLLTAVRDVQGHELSVVPVPDDGSGRHSAVLMALASPSGTVADADILLLERSATMRNHAGQVAFPGGATDPVDASPSATALREAAEEVGLQPESVDILAELPELYLPASRFLVTPVLAHWREPHPVGVRDVREVAQVARVPLAELIEPANRFTVAHSTGYRGPAFAAAGLFVWGFTAGLLDRLLRLGGWERPWDGSVLRPLPEQGMPRSGR
jgi:8-oxo-dGTP pyrophosphatase MutT (NUDIX family)